MREPLVQLDMGMAFAGQLIARVGLDAGEPRVGCNKSTVRYLNRADFCTVVPSGIKRKETKAAH